MLRAALWQWRGNRHTAAVSAARAGRFLGFVMIALGVLQVVTGRGLGGVWLALIGWFVVSAATAEEQQARLDGQLAGVTVGQVMTAPPIVLDGNLTVDEFIARVALTHPFSTYPLVDLQGRLTGLVTLNRVRAVPPELRATTRLRDIACAPSEVPIARPEEPRRAYGADAGLQRRPRSGRRRRRASHRRAVSPPTSPVPCRWPTYALSIRIPHPRSRPDVDVNFSPGPLPVEARIVDMIMESRMRGLAA